MFLVSCDFPVFSRIQAVWKEKTYHWLLQQRCQPVGGTSNVMKGGNMVIGYQTKGIVDNEYGYLHCIFHALIIHANFPWTEKKPNQSRPANSYMQICLLMAKRISTRCIWKWVIKSTLNGVISEGPQTLPRFMWKATSHKLFRYSLLPRLLSATCATQGN